MADKQHACAATERRLLPQGHQGAITGVAFSADGSALATVCQDRALRSYCMDSIADSGLTFRRRRAWPLLAAQEQVVGGT